MPADSKVVTKEFGKRDESTKKTIVAGSQCSQEEH